MRGLSRRWKTCVKTASRTAEQQQRPGQRPQVAERGPEVRLLEVGDGDQVQELQRAPPAAAEGGGPAHIPQLRLACSPALIGRSLTLAHVDVERAPTPCRGTAVPVDQERQVAAERLERDHALGCVLADPAVEVVAARRRAGFRSGPRRRAVPASASGSPPAGRACVVKPKTTHAVVVEHVEHEDRAGQVARGLDHDVDVDRVPCSMFSMRLPPRRAASPRPAER